MAPPSTYKLYYYNSAGLGEITRLIFALNDIQYEDIRIPVNKETFPQLSPEWKTKTPWGQLPMLEIDGHKIAQSSSINRFLARRFNMIGDNEFEMAKCDEFIDAIKDYASEWQKLFVERNTEKQNDIKKYLLEILTPKYFNIFNNVINENDGKGLVGNNTTWADVYLCHYGAYLQEFGPSEYINKFPAIAAMIHNFYNKPQIKKWVENRPKPAKDLTVKNITDNLGQK